MSAIEGLVQSWISYAQELFVPVMVGFLFSGIINEFVPGNWIQKYLGKNSLGSIVMATGVGVLLPVCCMGTLPIAVTLRSKGAKLGPVLAFLVATPATSASAILAAWKMMGGTYTWFMCLAVILMGFVTGVIASLMENSVKRSAPVTAEVHDCCSTTKKEKLLMERLMDILVYAFFDLPKRMGLEIIFGICVASVIVSFEPVRQFINIQLAGAKGYGILVLVGLIDYVCSTASVPVAHALSGAGVSAGKSMVYLLMGPITSLATLIVIRKEYGIKILLLYVFVIAAGCVAAGITYDALFSDGNFMG